MKARAAIFLLVLAALAAAVILLPVREWLGGGSPWIDDHRRIAWLIYIALYVVATVCLLPGLILTISAGAIFGLPAGVALASVGSLLGATAAFFVGRTFARDWIGQKIAAWPRFRALDRALGARGFWIVLLTRLSPLFPFNLLNYAYGISSVRPRDYVLASWIGMFPATVLYVYAGSAAASLTAALSRGGGNGAHRPGAAVGGPRRDARRDGARDTARQSRPRAGARGMNDDADWTTHAGASSSFRRLSQSAARTGLQPRRHRRRSCRPHHLDRRRRPRREGRARRAARDGWGLSQRRVRALEDTAGRGDRRTAIFEAAMQRVRAVRAQIAEVDSVERYTKAGVDVFLGEASFASPREIHVGGAVLRTRKAVIATGARAAIPPVPGLAEAAPLTNETVFDLREQPRRLAVMGAGPIGCELAQAFARLGTAVEVIELQSRALPADEPDAAALVVRALQADGVRFRFDAKVTGRRAADGGRTADARGRVAHQVESRVLVAAGRRRNLESLALDRAGVRFDVRSGIHVDARLRTSTPGIYAAGDVCSRYQFTHNADAQARIVVRNALFAGQGSRGPARRPVGHLYEAGGVARGRDACGARGREAGLRCLSRRISATSTGDARTMARTAMPKCWSRGGRIESWAPPSSARTPASSSRRSCC